MIERMGYKDTIEAELWRNGKLVPDEVPVKECKKNSLTVFNITNNEHLTEVISFEFTKKG